MISLDAKILEKLKKGEEEGINLLFANYFAPLCMVAQRIIHRPDTAKDIVQDVFVKLWENRNHLLVTSSLMGYLKKSVINASIDHQRKAYEKCKVHFEDATISGTLSNRISSDETSQSIESKELARQIDQAVRSLPDRCRLIFVLSRYEGLSYKQIAEKLDISVKTVENQMTKALKTLRQLLSPLLTMIVILWGLLFFFTKT